MKSNFNIFYKSIMKSVNTIDSDIFLNDNTLELNPIWTRQFNILNEYVEDPELIPVPKQVFIDFIKNLRTKIDSIKLFSYEEIYEKLDDYDYEYSEEFKNNLIKYNIFNGHLTIAIIKNDENLIHQYLDKEFDYIKVNDLIRLMNSDPTGITDSWSRDLSDEAVIQKNVVILINRSLIFHGQDWKDTVEHEMTHFIQRIVGLDKTLKKKEKYFGEKFNENINNVKRDILEKTKLDKSYVDSSLNRFIKYIINPIEHDTTIKSCLNAFQREYEFEKTKIDRNKWLELKLNNIEYDLNNLFDEYFQKNRRMINSREELMKHRWLFALLTYKIMNSIGYDMNEKLKKHFKIFKYRDI